MQWFAISGIFALGAMVQALTGAGYALVAAPTLLLIAPQMVPLPLLLVGSVLLAAIVLSEAHAIDLRTIRSALIASLPGAALGAAALSYLDTRTIDLIAGGAISVAAALALAGAAIPATRVTLSLAGFGAGAMNSIAGMPGPPIALVYRSQDPAKLRTNLSLSYLLMSVVSVAVLYAERIGTTETLVESIKYLPAIVVGFAVARAVADHVSGKMVGRAVLWLALLSGIVLVLRTLVLR